MSIFLKNFLEKLILRGGAQIFPICEVYQICKVFTFQSDELSCGCRIAEDGRT